MGRVQEHNREMIRSAQFRAGEMSSFPSKLEELMKEHLNSWGIRYEDQKIFYIHADDGWIIRYYIADFYLPDKKLIIEVDGKFHEKHRQHDKQRTKDIQGEYPDIEVLRFTWKEVNDPSKMRILRDRLQQRW